jgi:hypothetical protein
VAFLLGIFGLARWVGVVGWRGGLRWPVLAR